MGWLDTMDRALGRLIEAGRWLVLPVALILFLQWPLRDFVQWGSREANDLGQWIFALYVSLAMTFATRERAHLAVDAIAHDYPARVRSAIARWGNALCVVPWALFMIWTVTATVERSVMALEKFPDTFNHGYFLIKIAALLLAVLALLQTLLDALRPARGP
jgi:TRAP-type mannitol/chloroaromatic compound transport system permease small subunit